jgi:hypothetical protein
MVRHFHVEPRDQPVPVAHVLASNVFAGKQTAKEAKGV